MSLQLAAFALFLLCGTGLFSPMSLCAQTSDVSTTATFVSEDVPSSVSNSFSITLQQTNATVADSLTYQDCTISGEPADGAVNVGNCRWTQFVDNGFNLLLFTFNWQDPGDVSTSAVFGQFCLLNDFGAGQWVRFFTSEGTADSVVGSASGSLTYIERVGLFPHGVASGDVTSSSAVLWTRIGQEAALTVEVSTDSTFQTLTFTQTVQATVANDFTAKVAVSSLNPDSTYFYRWRQGSAVSEVGTFKTAPLSSVSASVRFAFSGDSDGSKVGGVPFYNNFEVLNAARFEGLDFFVYLGDTVYSDFRGGGLANAQTLAEFRGLYQENREIAALRNLLKATSTYAIWDDHEVRNDWDGQTVAPTFFAIGRQAFLEYMPISETGLPADPACAGDPLFRVFQWGNNVDVIILDERSCRSADVEAECSSEPGSPHLAPLLPANLLPLFGLPSPPPGCLDAISDPSRTMLGSVQKELFKDALQDSTAKFKFVINEVPIQSAHLLPYDRWEGYGAERTEILNFIRNNNIENVIFLTTDSHANLINEVVLDSFTDSEPIADEFVTGPIATNTLEEEIRELAPDLDMDPDELLSDVNDIFDRVGIGCRHLDAFSYGVVDVDASAGTATITLKDDTGAVLVDQRNSTISCVKTIGP